MVQDPAGSELPGDWTDQITRAYQVFGIDNGTPVDQFGIDAFIRGAQRYWTTGKRKAKALRQRRNEEGEWVEERGVNLPDSDDPRGTLNPDQPATGAPLSPVEAELADVQPLTGAAAKQALEGAGFKNRYSTVHRFGDTHAVFTRDGKSFVTVPTPMNEMKNRISSVRRLSEKMRKELGGVEEQIAAGQDDPRATLELRRKKKSLEVNIKGYEDRIKGWEEELSTMVHEVTPEQMQMAQAALVMLENARAKLPAWRRIGPDGMERAYIANLDSSAMVFSPPEAGNASLDSDIVNINPDTFWRELPEVKGDYPGQRKYRYGGEGTINHELGHTLDSNDANGSDANLDVWEAAKASGGMTEYGETNPHEGYAEAWTMWSGGHKDNPAAHIYAEAFGWDQAEQPSPPERRREKELRDRSASRIPQLQQMRSGDTSGYRQLLDKYLRAADNHPDDTVRKKREKLMAEMRHGGNPDPQLADLMELLGDNVPEISVQKESDEQGGESWEDALIEPAIKQIPPSERVPKVVAFRRVLRMSQAQRQNLINEYLAILGTNPDPELRDYKQKLQAAVDSGSDTAPLYILAEILARIGKL